jgi:hypothetical protein
LANGMEVSKKGCRLPGTLISCEKADFIVLTASGDAIAMLFMVGFLKKEKQYRFSSRIVE